MDRDEQNQGGGGDGECDIDMQKSLVEQSLSSSHSTPSSSESSSSPLLDDWMREFTAHMWVKKGRKERVHMEAWDQIFLMSVLCTWAAQEEMTGRVGELVQHFCTEPLSNLEQWTCAEGLVRREQERKRLTPPSWCQLQADNMQTHCWHHLQDTRDADLPMIFLLDPIQANAVWLRMLQPITETGNVKAMSRVIEALNQLQNVSMACTRLLNAFSCVL
jgi:hypothetical protein